MPKIPLGINTLTAAKIRIRRTFDEFENIYISFSGGKDSTIMLHLVMDEAIKRDRKIGILFVDLEAQYKLTIEHTLECFEKYAEYADPYWVALPINLRNAVSVYEPFWRPWEPGKEEAWVRKPPQVAITDIGYFPFFSVGMEFEEFVPEFGRWYADGEACACFVGIRADESLNRYRTIASSKKTPYLDWQWSTLVCDDVYNIYPIYDWKTEDVWIYHGKNPSRRYNKLYDLMHKAGLSIHQQRICQPYGDDQRRGLWLFHLIEPETWARVVARVNGANSGALYSQEWGNINGYRRITKPEGHTWESFANLLVNSLPPKTKEHFENKIMLHIRWWMERGYPEGIPDAVEYALEAKRLAPSWRRICKSLLRNDYWCKGLGFTQHKSAAYTKYLDLMRRRRAEWNMELF